MDSSNRKWWDDLLEQAIRTVDHKPPEEKIADGPSTTEVGFIDLVMGQWGNNAPLPSVHGEFLNFFVSFIDSRNVRQDVARTAEALRAVGAPAIGYSQALLEWLAKNPEG